jgi:hypothetical protein
LEIRKVKKEKKAINSRGEKREGKRSRIVGRGAVAE